jgi:hypothetical protein
MSCSFLFLSPEEIQSLYQKWKSPPFPISESSTITYSPKPYAEWNPYEFTQIQTYNPLYSKISTTPQIENAILPSYYVFHDLHSVSLPSETKLKPKSMFIKFSPLLDPLRYLTGKYGGSTNDYPELKQLPSSNRSALSTSLSTTKDSSLQKGIRKLYDPNNASYVDGFFYYLSSHLMHNHEFVHGIDFYGSFLAIQNKFRMNIYDDITYLRRYSYFNQNREKDYHIYDQTFLKYLEFEKTKGQQERNSRKNHKKRLELSSIPDISEGGGAIDIMELLGVEDLMAPEIDNIPQPVSSENELPETMDMDSPFFSSPVLSTHSQAPSYSSSPQKSAESEEEEDSQPADLSDDDDSDTNSSDSECPPVDDEENETLYAYIDQFPVQMICMETCHGTLDQLFVHQILNPSNYDTEGASMMFQVVATLMAYQKAFHFTHNDLHTNNIMWISTPIQYLYYQIQGRTYRVPTYNRIYKIIDFGRAIYEFQGQRFCSDSFASPEGDAATQYNCEPYLMPGKPVIEPNPSFDLCRLACAIYDFLMDVDDEDDVEEGVQDDEENDELEPDEEEEEEEDEEQEGGSVWEDDDSTEENPDSLFAQLIIEWCQDDKGRNMLYKKSGKERYPYFKLYQMIARTVHRHIPLQQIHNPLFAPFLLPEGAPNKKKKSDICIDLDALPDYS